MAAMVPEGQTMEPVARALGSRAFASPWGLRQEWGVGLWPSACVVEPRVCGGVWICEESAEEAWLARGAAARHGRIWDRLNVYECSDAVPLVFKHVTPRRAGRSEHRGGTNALIKAFIEGVAARLPRCVSTGPVAVRLAEMDVSVNADTLWNTEHPRTGTR
jgi:hypothetical protein